MRKRIFAALVGLCMMLFFAPATALAAEDDAPDTLWVGNQQVRSDSDITYWTTDGNGALTQSSANGNWTVKYDPNTAALTLSEATIDDGAYNPYSPYGAGIYALCSDGQSVSLTIELIGENTIRGYRGIYVEAEAGNYLVGQDASLFIKNGGDASESGSLTVIATGSYGISVKGGRGNASLRIENSAVTINAKNDYAAGVCIQSSAYATSSPGSPLKSMAAA